MSFPPNLDAGIYGFDDENPTFTNPQLAWQYYVVGDEGRGALKSGEVGGGTSHGGAVFRFKTETALAAELR